MSFDCSVFIHIPILIIEKCEQYFYGVRSSQPDLVLNLLNC